MRSARLLHARVRTEPVWHYVSVRWGMFLLLCLFGRNIAAGYMAMLVRSRRLAAMDLRPLRGKRKTRTSSQCRDSESCACGQMLI